MIIANNVKADVCVRNSAGLEIYGTTLEKGMSGNPRLYDGYKYIQYHPFVLLPIFCRKVLPRKIWLNIVENKMPYKLFWAPFKILQKLRIKKQIKKLKKQYGVYLGKWFVQEKY